MEYYSAIKETNYLLTYNKRDESQIHLYQLKEIRFKAMHCMIPFICVRNSIKLDRIELPGFGIVN